MLHRVKWEINHTMLALLVTQLLRAKNQDYRQATWIATDY